MTGHDLSLNGSQFARVWIPWSLFEPCPKSWSWQFFDKVISSIVRSGQKVYITLASVMSPDWFWTGSGAGCSDVPLCGGRGVGESHQMKYWDGSDFVEEDTLTNDADDTVQTADADNPPCPPHSHEHIASCVTSAHLSIFEKYDAAKKAGCDNPKAYIKRFINKAFDKVLDKWGPYIIDVQVSLGRLNEPTYPDTRRFWCYDNAAVDSWRDWTRNPNAFPPKEEDLAGLSSTDRGSFLDWYRKQKQDWVEKVSKWVTDRMTNHPWQRYVVFPAGGWGDVLRNDGAGTYLDLAKANWNDPNAAVKPTLRHMQDNKWLLGEAADHSNWYAQYAGVNGKNGEHPHETDPPRCTSAVCQWLPKNKNGYGGPLYAQIASLVADYCEQPVEVAQAVYQDGDNPPQYYGHLWNKDNSLFKGDGITKLGCPNPDSATKRLDKLADGWDDIASFYNNVGFDRTDPEISGLCVNAGATSATLQWNTDEDSDTMVLFGKKPGYEDARYMKFVGWNNSGPRVHDVDIDITSGPTYYAVFSTDAAGNTAVKEGSFAAGSGNTCGGGGGGGGGGSEGPHQTYPIGGQWIRETTPNFQWDTMTGATGYRLEVFKGTQSIHDHTFISGADHQYALPSGILQDRNGDYSWQLKALVSGNYTNSSTATFGVYNSVFVNLSKNADHTHDDEQGLKRGMNSANEPCDGRTVDDPSFAGKPSMRKNKGKATIYDTNCGAPPDHPACTENVPCQYIYFDVDDGDDDKFNTPGANTHVKVYIHYYNHKPLENWADYYCVKYKDKNENPHHACQSVPASLDQMADANNGNGFDIDDIYFGGKVAGHDLRIECRTDSEGALTGNKDTRRWIDTVTIEKQD